MKKFVVIALMLFSMAAFAQTTQNTPPPTKDGVYYVGKAGKKIGRVSVALFKSGVNGLFHLGVKDAPVVGKAVVKAGVHAGKDVVATGKAIVTDVKK